MAAILKWEDACSWQLELELLAPQIFNPDMVRAVAKRIVDLDDIAEDNLEWLQQVLLSETSDVLNFEDDLCRLISRRYTHLQAYHGCRPENICPYYSEGIQPLVPEQMQAKVRKIFSSKNFPELNDLEVTNAIAAVSTAYRAGLVFFECNKHHLLNQCGHYLLYGSEYVIAIARHILPKLQDYAQSLKAIGKPTLLVCNVPMQEISHDIRCYLGKSLAATYFKLALNPNYRHPRLAETFGFSISNRLPPECIERIEYPEDIRDPISNGSNR